MKVVVIEIWKDSVRIGYTTSQMEVEDYERIISRLKDVISNMKGMDPKYGKNV